MIDFSKFDSLIAMTMYFNNEDTCRQAIVETRWGVGESQDIVCPYCGQHHCATRKDGKFRCNKCKRNFSCRVGTIFEDSNLSLVKWFIAMYLISSHKKGVSSCQLSRDIKVCQATAWYMLQKIRKLYGQDDSNAFVGEVYTNNIEGFWSHFRRMITGCYHDVSDEHLQSYIDEAVYRWNTRKASQSERFSDMFNKSIGLIVTWNELKLCKVA